MLKGLSQQINPLCIILSFVSFTKLLSEDGEDKLSVLLDKLLVQHGVSFIICDLSANIQRLSLKSWYKKYCAMGNGIWVGDGVTDQYQLKITKTTSEMYKDIGSKFGYVINSGKYQICKLVQPENEEEENRE